MDFWPVYICDSSPIVIIDLKLTTMSCPELQTITKTCKFSSTKFNGCFSPQKSYTVMFPAPLTMTGSGTRAAFVSSRIAEPSSTCSWQMASKSAMVNRQNLPVCSPILVEDSQLKKENVPLKTNLQELETFIFIL